MPLAGDDFTDVVMRRIKRRVWLRRIVLSTALLVGAILVVGPFAELAVSLSEGLLVIATRWNDPAWVTENRALVILALLSVLCPGVLRWLEQ